MKNFFCLFLQLITQHIAQSRSQIYISNPDQSEPTSITTDISSASKASEIQHL